MSLTRQLFDQWEARPERVALVEGQREWTGRELLGKVRGLTAHLREQGLKPGERFATLLPRGVDLAACYLAALYGGFTVVPIDLRRPASEREFILRDCQPNLCLSSLPNTQNSSQPCEHEGWLSLTYTSGTTSQPKGVGHTAQALLENAAAFNRTVGLDDSVRMLHLFSLAYMAGILNTLLCPWLAGGCVVLAPRLEVSSALGFWERLRQTGANAVWLTPTMANLLSRLNRGPVEHSLDRVFVGTAPLGQNTRQAFEEKFSTTCLESYGLTEVLIVSCQSASSAAGSVGRPLEGVTVAVRDLEGCPLAAGEVGQIWVQQGDTWFASGDLGQLSEEGELTISGRLKDLIIKGGTNISPRAVEEVLNSHSLVREAAVVGAPHPFWGEEVVAFLATEGTLQEAELERWCRERLSTESVPSSYRFVEELPRNSVGKLKKDLLRSQV